MNLFEYLDASPKERLIEIKRVLNLTLENPNAETDMVGVFVNKANSIQTVKSILNNTMEIGFMGKLYKDIIYNVANFSLEDLKDIKNLLSDCMEKLQSFRIQVDGVNCGLLSRAQIEDINCDRNNARLMYNTMLELRNTTANVIIKKISSRRVNDLLNASATKKFPTPTNPKRRARKGGVPVKRQNITSADLQKLADAYELIDDPDFLG